MRARYAAVLPLVVCAVLAEGWLSTKRKNNVGVDD